jgi:hypothetical protein
VLSRLLADIILFFHFAFVVFAIFGGLIVLYKPRVAWVHVPVVLWSAVINLASWICPLTPLENFFRSAAGQAGYKGGFVEHYIAPLVYPGGMPRELEIVAGVSILVWNGFMYIYVAIWARRR